MSVGQHFKIVEHSIEHYEFLRTWLQRASKLISYSERLASLKTEAERAAYVKAIEAETQEKAKHVKLAPGFYADHVARVGDKEFIKTFRDYRDPIKELFRETEAICVPLAKHKLIESKLHKRYPRRNVVSVGLGRAALNHNCNWVFHRSEAA